MTCRCRDFLAARRPAGLRLSLFDRDELAAPICPTSSSSPPWPKGQGLGQPCSSRLRRQRDRVGQRRPGRAKARGSRPGRGVVVAAPIFSQVRNNVSSCVPTRQVATDAGLGERNFSGYVGYPNRPQKKALRFLAAPRRPHRPRAPAVCRRARPRTGRRSGGCRQGASPPACARCNSRQIQGATCFRDPACASP